MKRCFYEILGLQRSASTEEIRKAYKREALKYHPDRNPDDDAAEAKFKEVNGAYQVLSDEQKRTVYDQFGHSGLEGGAMGDGDVGDMFSQMQDLFSEMFSGGFGFGGAGRQRGRQRKGQDIQVQQRLTLVEAAFGCKREVTIHAPAPCADCDGTGAKSGTKPEPCAQCRGQGQVSSARGFVMFTSPCPKCRGQGMVIKTPCKTCNGDAYVQRSRSVVVAFPAGIDSNQRLRVPGQGMAAPNVPSGDLYVDVDVEENPRFERDGADLVTKVPVAFTEAALGATVKMPALSPEGLVYTDLEIPPGTHAGAVLTLKNQGIPRLDGRGRGALVAVIEVEVPHTLTATARTLLEQLDAELRPHAEARRDIGVVAPQAPQGGDAEAAPGGKATGRAAGS